MFNGDVMQNFKQNLSILLNLINRAELTFVSREYPGTMCTFSSYGEAVHFSKLLFYCVSYYSSQMLFPCCDVMHSKSGDSLVKFNLVVMYALKIKSMATMDITAAHFKYKPSITLRGELKLLFFPTFSVKTSVSTSLLFQTF